MYIRYILFHLAMVFVIKCLTIDFAVTMVLIVFLFYQCIFVQHAIWILQQNLEIPIVTIIIIHQIAALMLEIVKT